MESSTTILPPNVYVTQEQPGHNYSQAEDYGDVVFLTQHDVPTVRTSLTSQSVIESLARRMKGYRPGIDYILPAGSPLNIAAVFILAGRFGGSQHNILKWESRIGRYNAVQLEVPL